MEGIPAFRFKCGCLMRRDTGKKMVLKMCVDHSWLSMGDRHAFDVEMEIMYQDFNDKELEYCMEKHKKIADALLTE